MTHIERFISGQELKVYLHKYGLSRSPTKKECNGVKSHDLGGQLILPRREGQEISLAIKPYSLVLCGNHIFSKSYS